MLYWQHREEIMAELGSAYGTRHKQPALGTSNYPKVEYPACKPETELGWNVTCAGDPLASQQGALRALFPNVVDTCGVNIRGCSFNEVWSAIQL